jgi:hypothetical protein
LGIRNLLALRGDPPRGKTDWVPIENGFNYAVDLVRFIREKYGDYFCIGVAGYPEKHLEAKTRDDDIRYLKEKVDAGADSDVVETLQLVSPFIKIEFLTKDQLKVANEETLFNLFERLSVYVRISDYLHETVNLKSYIFHANSIYIEIERRKGLGEFADPTRFNFSESLKLLGT